MHNTYRGGQINKKFNTHALDRTCVLNSSVWLVRIVQCMCIEFFVDLTTSVGVVHGGRS